MKPRVIIFGGSGFLGQEFACHFHKKGHPIVIVSRSGNSSGNSYQYWKWDGKSVGDWAEQLDTNDIVINLAGHTINCVHNSKNRKLILDSRIDSVNAVSNAILKSKTPPKLYFQAGSIARFNNNEILSDENAPIGRGFTSEVSVKWENEFNAFTFTQTQKIHLRIGFILGVNGGAFPPLFNLAKKYIGGAVGSGDQKVSWIHIQDFMRILDYAIAENVHGSLNICNPTPCTNAELMKALRKSLNRPWVPKVPAIIAKFVATNFLKTAPSLALDSVNAIPKKMLDKGFKFKFDNIYPAVLDLSKKM